VEPVVLEVTVELEVQLQPVEPVVLVVMVIMVVSLLLEVLQDITQEELKI
jgi:hypothetical protein